MPEQVFAKLPADTRLLLHSHQVWYYRHKRYTEMLHEKGILQKLESMEHFKQQLFGYIDYCNNKRIKAKLKGLPPALHRQQALLTA